MIIVSIITTFIYSNSTTTTNIGIDAIDIDSSIDSATIILMSAATTLENTVVLNSLYNLQL